MKITIKFTPNMRVLTAKNQITLDLDENTHLSTVLKILANRYGETIIDKLYASEVDFIDVWPSIIVDGKVITLPLKPQSDIKLKVGSVVILMSPVSGG